MRKTYIIASQDLLKNCGSMEEVLTIELGREHAQTLSMMARTTSATGS